MILNKQSVFAVCLGLFLSLGHSQGGGSFLIDFNNNTFLKDSKPFRYVSGSVHSYRIPNELWEDRLNKMWVAGLNAIQTYIFWNEHEPYPGVYDFEGQNDIFRFLTIAQKIGFVVVLRPGPYICGEHEYGGLPWWLLANGTDKVVPRSSEATYMNAVRRWYNVLFPKLAPFLYKNGGPIITVQVENEYGSYYTCDKAYTGELRDLSRQLLDKDVVLFSTDPPHLVGLTCGTVDGVYPTVDFGVSEDPNTAFGLQRKFSTSGPFVNSEFYPGWLDFWGSAHSKVKTEDIISSFKKQLDLNANVNFYMFHGGTNFGFSNGADPPYLTEPTSYDYDAPLSEAGDITDKYLAIRETISKYMPVPQVPLPANSTKMAWGRVQMTYHVPLVDAIHDLTFSCVSTPDLQTFEKLGQGYGFVLYTTILDDPNVDGKELHIPGVRDRAYIQIGSSSIGVLYRAGQNKLKIKLPNNYNTTLSIIIENMGRFNFGNDLLDTKGIVSNVTIGGKVLNGWTACLTKNFIPNYQKNVKSFPSFDFFKKYMTKDRLLTNERIKSIDFNVPAVYIGQFDAPSVSTDSFLKMDKFKKGLAFIRSSNTITNLGRYWPNIGPQVTLYTPGVFTTLSATNYVALVEFEGSSCQSSDNCYTEFIDYPIIDNIPIDSNNF